MATAAQRAGERIREARKAKGWDLRQLGSAAGLDFGFVGKVERGSLASVPVYERLAVAVGLTLDALFGSQGASLNTASVRAPATRKAPVRGRVVPRSARRPARRSTDNR